MSASATPSDLQNRPFGNLLDDLRPEIREELVGFHGPEEMGMTVCFADQGPQGVFFALRPEVEEIRLDRIVREQGAVIKEIALWIGRPVQIRVGLKPYCRVGGREIGPDTDRQWLDACSGLALGVLGHSGIKPEHLYRAMLQVTTRQQLEERIGHALREHLLEVGRRNGWGKLHEAGIVFFPSFQHAPIGEDGPNPFTLNLPVSGIKPDDPFWPMHVRAMQFVADAMLDGFRQEIRTMLSFTKLTPDSSAA